MLQVPDFARQSDFGDTQVTPRGVPMTYINAATPLGTYLSLLSEIAKAGLLKRLRQCVKCQRWFAARVEKKRHCSSVCQLAKWDDHRKTDEWRAIHKEQVRQWRAKRKQQREEESNRSENREQAKETTAGHFCARW
ncbi:MAG TPA: hypothetical protein VIX19_14345 [Terriglobales bacterium]